MRSMRDQTFVPRILRVSAHFSMSSIPPSKQVGFHSLSEVSPVSGSLHVTFHRIGRGSKLSNHATQTWMMDQSAPILLEF